MKTLFKGGTIYDGSGARPYVGDVLIEDDRILKVGNKLTGRQRCRNIKVLLIRR